MGLVGRGCRAAREAAAEEVLPRKQQGANFSCPLGQQAERSIALQSWALELVTA